MERERWKTRSEPELSTARDVAASDLAARQHGVLNVEDLGACGLDHDAIAVRCDNGHLHRVHKAVYPDVLVLGESAPQHPLINGHRTNYLPASHITTVQGIPVTTAARTLLDLAGELSEPKLRRAVRQAQYLKLTTIPSLLAVLQGPGPQRGRKKLARIIATGAAPTQSELEDATLDLILRGGFAHPSVNEPLFLEGRRIVPDFRWPEQRLIVEADGPHHDDPLERAADRERQRVLEAHGFRVIRVTWKQVVGQPAATLRRIGEAGAPRAVDNSG